MNRQELRELWLSTEHLACAMIDGKYALLIRGPSDEQVRRDDWRFGFQVHGEDDIRWLQPEQLKRDGAALIQTA
jgi:hypothetical protein